MKLLLIDGNSIANRSFYGIRPLSNKKGVFTHAITGFFNTFLRLQKKYQPECVAVAFDLKAPTFRKQLYDGYKAGRKGMPDELAVQMPYIKEILRHMGVCVVEQEGFEADDIIGTLAHSADKANISAVISTGDRDAYQLITNNVTLNLVKTKEDLVYTPTEFTAEFLLQPQQMIEVKALQGDSSDNIPGVAGIGEKTALSLIQKYNSIAYIYENIDTLDITDSMRKKLIAGKEMCFISRQLGEIRLDTPISTAIADYRLKGKDEAELSQILTELEMFGLLKKLNVSPTATVQEQPQEQSLPTASLDESAVVVYLKDGELMVLDKEMVSVINDAETFLQSEVPKYTFDIKALWAYAYQHGYRVANVTFDTTLAAYLLNVNASEYGLERLCGEYGVIYQNDNVLGSIYQLNAQLYSRLSDENMLKLLTDIEIPLAQVLSFMEKEGITLDTDGVIDFGRDLDKEIAENEEKIYALAGEKFNIGSPKQLGIILFEKLQLPSGKKTKTGYSTNAEVLDFLSDKHPIIPLISEYRTLTKLKSTYVLGLMKVVSEDGKIHSTFKQTETRTGRISSAEPNIQNIPVRTKRGRKMRSFFVAGEGKQLVDADYSQIELRVLAHMSGDKIMQNAFANGDDIHTITASQVFNQPIEWVTPEMRSAAKAVNFGIVYGIGAFSLSKDIGVSVSEADRYIKNYLGKYHLVHDYMEDIVKFAKKNGYVETMFGRRRYIPEINSTNKNIEALGKRIAMNTPIQGTAADIIKIAMINVFRRLEADGELSARLILQVHDELIVECDTLTAPKVEKLLQEEMSKAVKLSIPLIVDVRSGRTWFETH